MLNLHALLPRSRANGPGVRLVLWFQGCTLGCPGCFNPTTHAPEPQWLEDIKHVPPAEVQIDAAGNISLSGIDPPSIASLPHAEYWDHQSAK